MGRRSRSRRLVPALTARLVDGASLPWGIVAPAPRDCRRIFDAHSQPQPRAARSSLSVEEQPPPRTPYSTCQFTTLSTPELPVFRRTWSTSGAEPGPAGRAQAYSGQRLQGHEHWTMRSRRERSER